MFTVDDIIAKKKQLERDGANEAETRKRIIDHILFGILGWREDDSSFEEPVSEDGITKYLDYKFRTGMTAFVVEAKRIGKASSQVPETRKARLNRKLVSGELGEVIIQARDYARQKGIPFAVATDGDYWIIFPATRVDEIVFSDSFAVIFKDINSALKENYSDFHSLLSREAVIGGSLENEFLGRIDNQIEERRLNKFFDSSFSRVLRNNLYHVIESAISTAFTQEVVNESVDLLEKCYVRTAERIKFDSKISLHIIKRNSSASKPTLRPMRDKDTRAVQSKIQSAADNIKPAAILILGTVGAGKTTFLEYTHKVSSREFFTKTENSYPHWIQVDFRGYSRDIMPLEFIHNVIREFINNDAFMCDYEKCVKPAYSNEIDALFRGPLFLIAKDVNKRNEKITDLLSSEYANNQSYNEKILKYASEKSPLFLVIDNVDQFEDIKIQSDIFSTAIALAHRVGVNLIFSLREATYVLHKNTPTFDAFDFDPITIDSPDIQSVLSKRFFVAKQLLRGKSSEFVAENGAFVRLSDSSIIIDLVQSSVLGSEIGRIIEVLSSGDVRLSLRMTREFLQSGYSSTGKALETFQRTGKYLLPPHEALRAIMVGNQAVYSEKYSVIGNPLDANMRRTETQLLRLYILSGLVHLGADQSFQGIKGEDIRLIIRNLGFGDDVTISILTDLCRLRFAYTLSHSSPEFSSTYVASRLGGYIIRELLCDFTFLENVMVDTFIADTAFWKEVNFLTEEIYRERHRVKKFVLRKTRVEKFFAHTKDAYEFLRSESLRKGFSAPWCVNPLQEIEYRFLENANRALKSANRNYGERSS